jgi:hypothetical protein
MPPDFYGFVPPATPEGELPWTAFFYRKCNPGVTPVKKHRGKVLANHLILMVVMGMIELQSYGLRILLTGHILPCIGHNAESRLNLLSFKYNLI